MLKSTRLQLNFHLTIISLELGIKCRKDELYSNKARLTQIKLQQIKNKKITTHVKLIPEPRKN